MIKAVFGLFIYLKWNQMMYIEFKMGIKVIECKKVHIIIWMFGDKIRNKCLVKIYDRHG
jgi:hypothetical protein